MIKNSIRRRFGKQVRESCRRLGDAKNPNWRRCAEKYKNRKYQKYKINNKNNNNPKQNQKIFNKKFKFIEIKN